MRRSWLGVGVLLVVLGSSAACDPLGSGSAAPPGTAAGSGAAAPAGSGAAASAGSAAGKAAPSAGASGFDLAAFCALAKDKGAKNFEVFDAQSSTPEEARQMLANIDTMAVAAPDELHDDFARFDDFEHRLMDAGGNATGDLADEAGGQELRDALNRIAAYLDENCGIRG